MSEIKLNTIEEAIEDFREGKFLIVVDDEDRENEGDFIVAAEKITPEKSKFHDDIRSWCIMRPDHRRTLPGTGPGYAGCQKHLYARDTVHRNCR